MIRNVLLIAMALTVASLPRHFHPDGPGPWWPIEHPLHDHPPGHPWHRPPSDYPVGHPKHNLENFKSEHDQKGTENFNNYHQCHHHHGNHHRHHGYHDHHNYHHHSKLYNSGPIQDFISITS